jgi:hypothetical protein
MKKTFETPPWKATSGSANSPPITALVKGQIWKTGETYVVITDTGKLFVHYKMTKKLLQRGLRKHLASMTTVQAFLKSNRAELLAES